MYSNKSTVESSIHRSSLKLRREKIRSPKSKINIVPVSFAREVFRERTGAWVKVSFPGAHRAITIFSASTAWSRPFTPTLAELTHPLPPSSLFSASVPLFPQLFFSIHRCPVNLRGDSTRIFRPWGLTRKQIFSTPMLGARKAFVNTSFYPHPAR